MQRSDLLLGEFESVRSVYHWDDGELVRLAGNGAGPLLAYVPASEQAGRDVLETMALVACPGVPVCRRTIRAGSGATALVLEGADDARPLALVHDLPAATLRSGLTALLRALNHVHSRGIVHRSIDRSTVLADPSGRFWLIGWGSARPVSEARRPAGSLTEATADLRDLACAFREALLRRPWPDPQAATIHDRRPRTHAGQDLIDVGVKVDRDFARVLSRLVGCDPRETYSGATDVLVDLSVEDATAFDPWESLPLVGMRREVARVLRLLDDTQRATSESVVHAASVDYLGPSGAGKSRVLGEIARAARSRDVIVLTAEGGARGTWGGVGALARQLVQLLGRDARMCRQHEYALRHLLDDRDPSARPQPQLAPGLGIEGRNTLTSSCTAALTDMVRIAFRTTPGLLLLDDEENLPAAARDVWRASGQFVQAINGAGGVLRALLVSASTHSYPAEIGAHRVTVELRTWRQRDLEKFLAQVFASPGGTRDVSVAIHRVTGGRPGDVIAYLRDLESRGALRREGLRWRLDVPLASLPALTGGVAEQVRRALDSCGRDATSLAEVLAVASDVTLGRSAVAEISDVRGPRLASAAEAAIAAGLVIPDGSAWRVRTDAIAHKLLATIPDDRRKVLHREVLQHLLDTTPDAIDPIAHHARASADPRAPAWTDQAIARARGEGSWTRAVNHISHNHNSLINQREDASRTLLYGELLTNAGRLSDAIEVLRPLTDRMNLPPGLSSRAHAALGRALFQAREWEQVADARLPASGDSAAPLAELRYIRACALIHLSRVHEAQREARLAAAELDSVEPTSVALARLEWEYLSAFCSRVWETAKRALVSKLRLVERNSDRQQFVLDLAKLANLTRVALGDRARVRSMVVRANQLLREHPNVGGLPRFSVCTIAALGETESLRRRHRLAVRAFHVAVQFGIGQYAIAARVRSIAAGIDAGRSQFSDKAYVVNCAERVNAETHTALLALGADLGICLVYYGHQDELESLLARLVALRVSPMTTNPVRALAIVGRVFLRESIDDLIPNSGGIREPVAAVAAVSALSKCDYEYAVVAHYAIQHAIERATLTPTWSSQRVLEMTKDTCERGWGTTCLALAALLWIPMSVDVIQRSQLISAARRRPVLLPIGLQWQRLLADSRWYQREGDFRTARAVHEQAMAELQLLRRTEHGVRGARAVDAWTSILSAQEAAQRDRAAVSGPSEGGSLGATEILSVWRLGAHAEGGIQAVLRHGHGVLESVHQRELELLAEELEGRGLVVDARCASGAEVDARVNALSGTILLMFPNLWSSDSTRQAVQALLETSRRSRQLIALTTEPIEAFRARGATEAALVARLQGPRVVLPSVIESIGSDRRLLILWAFRVFAPNRSPSDEVVEMLAGHNWPGGVGELESLMSDLVRDSGERVELPALKSAGWLATQEQWDATAGQPDLQVLRVTADHQWHSIADISNAAGLARRTALRHTTRLVERGRLIRVGRGRATRYRFPAG